VGLECPKGALLHGPPGVGKTLLVRTVARDTGAALVAVNGSDIFNSFLGESERNLREVFLRAMELTKTGPCVLFIDEIDALCPRREVRTDGRTGISSMFSFLLFTAPASCKQAR